jgi:hypothetical protein
MAPCGVLPAAHRVALPAGVQILAFGNPARVTPQDFAAPSLRSAMKRQGIASPKDGSATMKEGVVTMEGKCRDEKTRHREPEG